MIGKTRHLYNRNVRIFPRVMPVGCLGRCLSSVITSERTSEFLWVRRKVSMGPTESFYLSDGEFLWVRRRVHTVLTALTVPRVPIALAVSSSHSSLTALTAPIATTATTASTPPRESTLLVRIPKGQTHKGVQSVSSSQSVSQFKSLSQVRRSRSSSRRLFIRLILSIRFSQIRI